MAELSSNFWNGWVIGLTALSLAALVWLSLSLYFARRRKDEPEDVVWDETLREENNPAPWWWLGLLFALLVFTVLYLILYPGFGNYPGMLHWSQESQIQKSTAADATANADLRARWRAMTAAELGDDATAMRVAARLFRNNCAVCHADNAGGIDRIAPDLTDAEWVWGDTAADIARTITAGRTGVMPPFGPALGEDGVREVAEFVLNGLGDNADTDGEWLSAGRAKYGQFCAVCHGPAGKGNPALGAPDLSNNLWLYGGDPASIRASIRTGRTNTMPGQGTRLNDTQVQLLTAWLLHNADAL